MKAVFAFYDPDIEWDATGAREANPDLADVYRGHEGVRTYWRRWLQAWEDLEFEVQDVLDAGDGGGRGADPRSTPYGGGAAASPADIPPYGLVFTIRNGKVRPLAHLSVSSGWPSKPPGCRE